MRATIARACKTRSGKTLMITNLIPRTYVSRFIVRLFAAGCLLIFISACDETGDNYLEGSVTDGYNMSFDKVRVRLFPSALSIEYVKNSDAGEKLPLKVTINHPEGELMAGHDYDVVTEGSISRGVGYDSSPLPELISGTIHLGSFNSEDGSEVTGDFKAVYRATSGAQINLRGGFNADLERVDIETGL